MKKFIGQEKIMLELGFLLKEIQKGSNYNILFRAPSGYGKTTLALMCLQKLGGINVSCYYLPNKDGYLDTEIDGEKRFHLIDEIHTFKYPETLYPILDSRELTFFLASNESGELKEPLKNRCIQFIFDRYSESEMVEIVKNNLQKYNLKWDLISEISSRCRGNPRVAKIVCERLSYVFNNYLIPKNYLELNPILDEILNIGEGGLNNQDKLYLDYLKKTERSSLSNIIWGTGIDRTTILTEIEPHLLFLEKIRISSRGREFLGENDDN